VFSAGTVITTAEASSLQLGSGQSLKPSP